MTDTSLEIQKKMSAMYAQLSDEQKLLKCSSLFSSAKTVAESVIKEKHPNIHGVDLRIAVFRWLYRSAMSESALDDIARHLRDSEHSTILNT